MNPPSLTRQDSLDSFVSLDELVDELYHGTPYVPPARPIYGNETYERWADARKFPHHGLRNYGRNTVFADRVPEFTQVHTMTKPVDQLKQDFNELKPLTRIPNPPEGIPPNRQYAHGKGFPKTISMGGTIIDLTKDEVIDLTKDSPKPKRRKRKKDDRLLMPDEELITSKHKSCTGEPIKAFPEDKLKKLLGPNYKK
jgi:hypothetical protein